LTEITDSPGPHARISGGYTTEAGTVTSTHSADSTTNNPNHGMINIAIKFPVSISDSDDVDTVTTPPTDGQVLTWVDANNQWEPADTSDPIAIAAPLTATSPGSPGQIAFDLDHVYIAVAQDTWKRATLSTWIAPSPLLFHFDESDGATTFANSGTLGGNGTSTDSQISTTNPKFGTASFFSDSSNSGTGFIPAGNVPDLSDGDFTIDFWIRIAYGGAPVLLAHYDEFNSDVAWYLSPDGTGYAFYYSTDGSTTTSISFSSPGSWATDDISTWHHIAVCRSGDTLRFFKDGVESANTGDLTGITIYTSTSDLRLCHGKTFGGETSFMNGYMDELRITNTAEYTTAFTPPTDPYAE